MGDANNNTTVKCGKCGGTGRINAFSHYAAGRCFQCGGNGNLGTITHEEERRLVAGGLRSTAGIVLDAAADGNEARANFYADAMIDDMFRIGTKAAREILDFVAAGHYYDSQSDSDHVCPAATTATTATTAKCCSYIIAKGRERIN